MTPRRYQVMYILTLDGKPVVIGWQGNGERRYYLVGQAVADVPVFKSLRTVREHVRVAQSQRRGEYGYVMLSVPRS